MHLSRGAKVDVDVYDEFNRPVVTLMTHRSLASGEHFRFWDGRNAVGQLLPGGSYLIQATARTATNTATSAVWVRLEPSRGRGASLRAGRSAERRTDDAQQLDLR